MASAGPGRSQEPGIPSEVQFTWLARAQASELCLHLSQGALAGVPLEIEQLQLKSLLKWYVGTAVAA